MKKFLTIMICSIFILGFGVIASADTVRAKVHVEADDNGAVSVSGEGASQFTAAVQYCTDKYADGCGNNVALGIANGSFALDKKGLKYHQNAFNLTTASGLWLRISDWENVTTGKNVMIIPGRGGSMFVYTGPIPQQ